MSHSAEYEWRQRQEDRRRHHLARIREVTAEFIARYETVLHDVRSQGLHSAVPGEFATLSRQVGEMRTLLATDPERARAISLALGREIHGLPRLARQAQEQAEAQAAQRRRELGTELNSVLDRAFLSISDPVARDFAYAAAAGIDAEIRTRVAQDAHLETFYAQLQSRMAHIVAQAESKAVEWKRAQRVAQRAAVRADMLADVKEVALPAGAALYGGSRAQAEALMAQANGEDEAGFDAALKTMLASADQEVVDEESRRAAVRAVYESLQQAGFAVDNPYLEDGDGGNVVVSARKPSGAQANFRIGVEGSLVYKFDHYEGAACKQDLDQVLPMLQQVYGISLSSERVLWDNPDRLSRDARPIDSQESQR